MEPNGLSRRSLLRAAFAGAAAQFLPGELFAQQDFWSLPRSLWLYRPATNEQVRVVYFADGKVVPKGYAALCSILRDVRANEAIHMDLVLLDILCGIQGMMLRYGVSQPLWTHSGYRNSETNWLTEGSARNSKHKDGKAWDGRTPGVPNEFVTRSAVYLNAGGVGYYQDKGFTHVDSGNVRFWRG